MPKTKRAERSPERLEILERIAKLEAELAAANETLARERKANDRLAKIIDKYLD